MRKIHKVFLMVTLVVSTSSFAQNNPFKTVQDLFSAMSEVNHTKMRNLVTSDFQLLEVGEDWTLDDLIKVVTPSEYSRRNYFNVIKTKTHGNITWVSYWNKATFTKGNSVSTVVWLESAVLINKNNNWEIQMLHSTRISPEKLPKSIVLSEYRS